MLARISHVANNDSILKFIFNQFIQSSANQCISISVQYSMILKPTNRGHEIGRPANRGHEIGFFRTKNDA